jgi:hypothetical protein
MEADAAARVADGPGVRQLLAQHRDPGASQAEVLRHPLLRELELVGPARSPSSISQVANRPPDR